jgi:hypothetical protein
MCAVILPHQLCVTQAAGGFATLRLLVVVAIVLHVRQCTIKAHIRGRGNKSLIIDFLCVLHVHQPYYFQCLKDLVAAALLLC